MALKGNTGLVEAATISRASDTFDRINKLRNLPKTTETLSFRVPGGEKTHIKLVFARNGLTLAEGLKKAVYAYLELLESNH